MRKILASFAVSLDGYIEGPNGEYDWIFMDQDYGISGFMKRIDTFLIGRKTYEKAGQMQSGKKGSKKKNPFGNVR